ncbi:MAG: PIF1 family DEAD/DEAH box helicase [Candidatus Moranbacteria bacterium]|nr:PIF1 family DEAD/DEAH box helicase [Candidatus Moranbacteria bacterium]
MDQKTAFEVLKSGANVFLTGPAGSGKTFLLNKYIDFLEENGIETAVTASTGIAATHIGGLTIHAWSGLGIKDHLSKKDLEKIVRKSRVERRVSCAEALVIDEISMLDANQLDNVNQICKRVRDPFLPFGGLQVVLCGDFFQLPPVSKGSAKAKFAFSAQVWQEAGIQVCYLDEQHRHQDDGLLAALNAIRSSEVDENAKDIIFSRRNMPIANGAEPTRLYTHNEDVDRINGLELGKIDAKAVAYKMHASGKKPLVQLLMKGCLAPETLALKIGARVMFVKNNFDEGYINGTMGTIAGFEKESKMPIVKTDRGKLITATPAQWEIEEDGEILAKIRQVPLRLAWAITVHKSQGMSLDAAEIDLRHSFEPGMGYVALSRVRTLDGLRLLGINDMSFEINREVLEADKIFAEMSKDLSEKIKAGGQLEKKKIFKKKISQKKRGSKGKSGMADFVSRAREKHPKAYMPWTEKEDEDLKYFFQKQKRPENDLAIVFQRKPGAIRARLKKLGLVEF